MKRVLLVCQMDPAVSSRFDRLIDLGFDLVRRQDLADHGDEADLAAALDGAWAVIAGNERYSERVLAAAPDLRLIARPGVGYDNVDLQAATSRGVAVSITPGTNHEAVAELTVGLMLAVVRRIPRFDQLVRSGGWRVMGLSQGLVGSTVGIVGLGLIGRAVARRLGGFGCRLLAAELAPDLDFCRHYGIELVDLDELLKRADVVSLHVPLHPPTYHLIDRARLKAMRPTAVLVNTSRGGVVDQQALIDALAAGELGGAGLDVFDSEPLPAGNLLPTFDSVVLTPHVAAHTTQAMVAMVDAAMDGIVQADIGNVPRGCLNPSVFRADGSSAIEVTADAGR
jgi:phosphoglycerate dehydrogenase-like enzyme